MSKKPDYKQMRYNFSGNDQFIQEFLSKYTNRPVDKKDFVQVYKRFGKDPESLIKGLYKTYAPDKYTDDKIDVLKKDYNMSEEAHSFVDDELDKTPTWFDYSKLEYEIPENLRKKVIGDKAVEYGRKKFRRTMDKGGVNIDDKLADQIYNEVDKEYGEQAINPYEALYRFNNGFKTLKQDYEGLFKSKQNYYKEQVKRAPSKERAEEIKQQYNREMEMLVKEFNKNKKKLANELNLTFKKPKKKPGGKETEDFKINQQEVIAIPDHSFKNFNKILQDKTKKIFEQKAKEAEPGFWKKFYKRLEVAGADILNIGNYILAGSEQIHNNILSFSTETSKDDQEHYWTDIAQYHTYQNEKLRQKFQKTDATAQELLEKRDYGGLAANTMLGVADALPDQLVVALMTAAGMPQVGLSYFGAKSSSQRLIELSDRDDLEGWKKITEGFAHGANEMLFERMGTVNIVKNVQKTMAKQGLEITENEIKKAMRPWFERTFQRMVNFAKPGGIEGIEEVSTTLSNDFATKLISNPNKKIGETAFDDFLVGFVSGKGISLPADVKSVYSDVAGDTEGKYIRRTLKDIPKEYTAGAKIDAMKLRMKRDVLEKLRRESTSNFRTEYDQEIEDINNKLERIDEWQQYLYKKKNFKGKTQEAEEEAQEQPPKPPEIESYATEKGFKNVHHALNTVRKNVRKDATLETLTKEDIDKAVVERVKKPNKPVYKIGKKTFDNKEDFIAEVNKLKGQKNIPNVLVENDSETENQVTQILKPEKEATKKEEVSEKEPEPFVSSNNIRVEEREGKPTAIRKDGQPYKNQTLPNVKKAINEYKQQTKTPEKTKKETTKEPEPKEKTSKKPKNRFKMGNKIYEFTGEKMDNGDLEAKSETGETVGVAPTALETLNYIEEKTSQTEPKEVEEYGSDVIKGQELNRDATKGEFEAIYSEEKTTGKKGKAFETEEQYVDYLSDFKKRQKEYKVKKSEPSKKVKSNIKKFVEDYNQDQNIADPQVKSSKDQAQKYLDKHGDWLYKNDRDTFDQLAGLIETSNSQYEGGVFKTIKERNEKVGTGTEIKEGAIADRIDNEVKEKAKEEGYESMSQLFDDYVKYGTYKGTPKPEDMVVGDIKSITAKKRKAAQEKPKEEKPKKESGIFNNISNLLSDIEKGIVNRNITKLKDMAKVENKSIGQYLIEKKDEIGETNYEILRNRYNSIARSLEQIKKGNLDKIPNTRIKRGVQGDMRSYEQAKTKMPKATKDFLDYTIGELTKRFPNIQVTYNTNLETAGRFTEDGVEINPEKAGKDTPIHEFAHPYVLLMKDKNRQLYSLGEALVEDSGLAEEVRKDMEKREDETDKKFKERVTYEAISRLVGEEGAKIAEKKYNRTKYKKIKDFVKKFWDWTKKQLGILPRYDVSKLSVEDFGRLVAKDMFNTQPLTKENASKIIEADVTGQYESLVLDNGALLYSHQGKTNFDNFTNWLAREFRMKRNAPGIMRIIDMMKKGAVRSHMQELRLNMMDFHKYLKKNYIKKAKPGSPFYKLTKPEIGDKLNGILQENLPMFNEDLTEAQEVAKQMRIMQDYGLPEDPTLVDKVIKMRSTLDKLSKELISSGLATENLQAVINSNLGVYITRTFKAHKSKNHKPSDDIRNRARAEVRRQHKSGLVDNIKYKVKKNGNIDMTINMKFSESIEMKDMTMDEALEFLDYNESDSPFEEQDNKTHTFSPVKNIYLGWKIDKEGNYINSKFETLDDTAVDNMLDQLINSNVSEALFRGKGGKGFSKSPYLGVLMQRKEIPDDILEFMGVEKDPYIGLYESTKKMANLLETNKALEAIKEEGMGKFLWRNKKEAPRGSEQISAPNSESYSPLDGLWTTPGTMEYLKNMDSPRNLNWVMKTILTTNGMIKAGFTIWNNITQMRNMLSWSAIHAANGTFNFSKDIKDHFQIALQDMGFYSSKTEFRQWHNKLIELHVLHENADFNDFQDFVRQNDAKPGRYFTDTWIAKLGKAGKTLEAMRKKGKSVERFVEQLYRFGDDLNKTIYFFNTLKTYEKAYPEMPKEQLYKEVAGVTIKTTPTYSDLPEAIARLRRSPIVGPFVSWPAAMVKSSVGSYQIAMKEINSGNDVLVRKGYRRLMGAFIFTTPIGGMMAQFASMMISGITGDEADKLEPMLAPWNKNTFKFFLPSKEPGKYRFIPLSYIDPYNYTNRIMIALLKHPDEQHKPIKEAIMESLKPYLSTDILFGLGLELASDIFTGTGKIVTPTDDIYTKTKDIIGHLYQGVKPGVIRNMGRIYKSTTEQKNVTMYGNKLTFGNELLSQTGFRVSELDIRQAMFYELLNYQDKIDNIRKSYRKYKYDPQKSDNTVKNKFYEGNKQARKEFKKMKDIVYDCRTYLGLTDKETVETLQDSNMPEWMIRSVITGQFPGMYKNPSKKLRDDLKERY